MSRRPVTVLVALAGLVLVPASATNAATAPVGATSRVSVATGGIQATGESRDAAISADGRYVAFSSVASNLVAGDTNGKQDVFIRDRVTGETTRVSLAPGDTQANDVSVSPAISADGRYVAFTSYASNLVAGDTNGTYEVVVRDRTGGATSRVSVANDGAQANGPSVISGMSADGRYVAFRSEAINLVAGDTNGKVDTFVRDVVAGATTRVSVSNGGAQASGFASISAISVTGRYVAFVSDASNLVTGDTNGKQDVFLRDLVAGTTTRVSLSTAGTEANNSSIGSMAISPDGRYVAFESAASNLVAGDSNRMSDVFLRDRITGATTRVSLSTGGAQPNSYSQSPNISADGRYVAFSSYGNNLVAGDTNRTADVFVRDRFTRVTTRVNVTPAGAQASGYSWLSGISADGRYVAFQSDAINLVTGDTNARADVFLRDRLARPTRFGDFNGDGWSDLIARRSSTGSLYLHRGNGTALTGSVRIGTGWNAMNVITRFGDFNRDGHEDVIARDSATASLWLYRGTGAGFSPRVKIGGGWSGMSEITPVGDLTGDGYPDLLAVQTSTGYLYVYAGRGTSLGAGRRIGGGWNAMSELAGVGDFNRDGRVDLIARKTATGALWLYRGTGTGLGSGVQVGTGWTGMRDLVGVGDFDRDGFNDVTAIQTSTGNLLRYPGRGMSLGSGVLIASGWTTAMRPVL